MADREPAPLRRYRSLVLRWLTGAWRSPRPAAVEPWPIVAPGQLGLTFGGHASVIARYADATIAIDPMLGHWIGPVRRAVTPGFAADHLGEVGLVVLTQLGRGHLDRATLRHVPRGATVVGPPGTAAAIAPLGFARVVELASGADLELRGVRLEAIHLPRGDGAQAMAIRGDGPTVLALGDTGFDPGLADAGARLAPDVVLLPIGGYWPRSFQARHLSPAQALDTFALLRARLLVPVGHGAFPLSYEHLDEPLRALASCAEERGLSPHVCALAPGETEVLALPRRGLAAVVPDGAAGGPGVPPGLLARASRGDTAPRAAW